MCPEQLTNTDPSPVEGLSPHPTLLPCPQLGLGTGLEELGLILSWWELSGDMWISALSGFQACWGPSSGLAPSALGRGR